MSSTPTAGGDNNFVALGFVAGIGGLLYYLLKSNNKTNNDNELDNNTKQEIEKMLTQTNEQQIENVKALKKIVQCVYDLYDLNYIKELPTNQNINCDCEFGFEREDFKHPTDKLVGRISQHSSHLLYLTKVKATEWDVDPEETQFSFLKSFNPILKKRKVKLSIAEAFDDEELEGNTFILLPEMIKLKNIKDEKELDQILEKVQSSNNNSVNNYGFENIQSHLCSTILICCHHQRDARCGYCGPKLYEGFRDYCIKNQIPMVIRRVNHLGGHKYAGNIIVVYQNKRMNKNPWFIDWYGYVSNNDIDRVMKSHFEWSKNTNPTYRVIKELWRGRPNLSKDMFEKFLMMQQ
ncbi:hypothetical protein ABK040_013129 [Willaertia magna]